MKTLLLLSFIGIAFGIDDKCLQCMCQLEGCDSQIGKCINDEGTPSCGPYQIKDVYWQDAGSPGGDWQTCTKEKECSEQTVRAYLDRYGPGCSNGNPTCEDLLRVHNRGPEACKPGNEQYDKATFYWKRAQNECQL